MGDGWLSVLPATITIVVAILSKRVLPSLALGLLVGGYLLHPSMLGGLETAIEHLIATLSDGDSLTRPLRMAMGERVRTGVTLKERDRLVALGEARALLYLLAIGTGLRRGELKRLRWADVDFEHGLVKIPAASAKSRKDQAVELHPRLLEALRAAMPTDVAATARVVPSRFHPTTRTFHADLVAAGIAQEERILLDRPNAKGETFKRRFDSRDASGRVVDFHALRTTFVTWLGMTGAHPRTAQALARHSTVEMTMQRYVDVRLLDLRAAVDRLPLPAGDSSAAAPASDARPIAETA